MSKGYKQPPNLTSLNSLAENKLVDKFIHSGSAESTNIDTSKESIAINESQVNIQDEEFPWLSASSTARTQHIVRIPLQLKELLDYLGDTSRGENLTSISVAGLTKIAEEMATKKGLPLPPNYGSWLKRK